MSKSETMVDVAITATVVALALGLFLAVATFTVRGVMEMERTQFIAPGTFGAEK